jgi:hypothetical protein
MRLPYWSAQFRHPPPREIELVERRIHGNRVRCDERFDQDGVAGKAANRAVKAHFLSSIP